MSHVRTLKPASPDQAPVEVSVSDPVIQPLGAQALEQLQRHVDDHNTTRALGGVDSVSGGGRTMATEIPQERTASFDDKVAAVNARKPVAEAGLPKIELSEAMARLAATGFSSEAQTKFAERVASVNTRDAAYMARTLRSTIPAGVIQSCKKLDEAFAVHGLRLDRTAPLDAKKEFASLDRAHFRQFVRDVVNDADGVLSRGDVMHILDQVNHVGDLDDLQFARWTLQRRVAAGQLKLAPGVDKLINGFFENRLDTRVDNGEIAFAARALRLAVSAADKAQTPDDKRKTQSAVVAAKARLKKIVSRALDDKTSPDAVFFAKRAVDRELSKSSCRNCAGASSLREELVSGIDNKIGDRLDRRTWNQKLDADLHSGKISQAQATVLRIGVQTSATKADLHYAIRDFEVCTHLSLMTALMDIELDILGAMSRALRETEEEKAQRLADERRADERRLEERRVEERHCIERVNLKRHIAHVGDDAQVLQYEGYESAAASLASQAAGTSDPLLREQFAGREQYLRGVAETVAPRGRA